MEALSGDRISSRFSVVSWPDGAASYLSEWNRLIEQGAYNPTLAPSWFAVIAGTLAPSRLPISVLLEQEDRCCLVGVIPYFVSSGRMLGLSVSMLQPGSNLMSYHAEIVSGDAVQSISGLLREAPPWDVFHMANVPLESRTATALRTIARDHGFALQIIPGDESPFLPINGSWAEFLATRSKKFRYKLRRRREIIESNADCTVRWFSSVDDVEELLSDILIVERGSWKNDSGLSIAARERELLYHRALLPYLASRGVMLATIVYFRGAPIAYSLCCSHRGWIGHLKTSFIKQYSGLSPGSYAIDLCVEKAFELGALEFDFLGDAAPHKLAWTARTRKHASFYFFSNSRRGRLVGRLKAIKDRVRTAARSYVG